MVNRPYTRDELVILADAYGASQNKARSTVSIIVFGPKNEKTFDRLAQGHGCNVKSVEKATVFFDRHWPDDTPWPLETPRRAAEPMPPRNGSLIERSQSAVTHAQGLLRRAADRQNRKKSETVK